MSDAAYVPKGSTRSKPSGAFEIYLNDELIFSKLQTGIVPEPEDIIDILKTKLKD